MLTAFLLTVAAVNVYTMTLTPQFEASAQLMIEAERPRVVIFNESVEQTANDADYLETQHKILQSRALARRTIDILGLWDDPRLGGGDRPPEPTGLRRYVDRLLAVPAAVVARFTKSDQTAKPDEAPAADETVKQVRVIDQFLGSLTIEPVRNSRLVNVKFRSTDAELAQSVANALATAYIEQNLEFKTMAFKEASDWLTQQLEEQRKQVEQSEAKLQAYREKSEAISTNQRENFSLQKLADLNNALSQAKTERIQKEALYRQVEPLRQNPSAIDNLPALLMTPYLQGLKSEVADLQRQERQMAEELGAKHPDMVKVRLSLSAADNRLRTEVGRLIDSLGNDVQAARGQEQSLMAAVEAQRRESVLQQRDEIEYTALERDAISDRQIFESLLQRTKETGVSGELPASNIRVVDAAVLPRSPVSPNKQRNLLLSFLYGAILSIGLAFFLEYLDKKIKTPEQIKEQLGLPCLGLVPAITNGDHPNPLLNNGVPSDFKEAFRTVRTNVLFVSSGENVRSILITSTGPHEGKTLVASNLAVSMAATGERVLLIDADLRRPKVHEVFDLRQEPGLSNLASGDAKASDVIRPSDVPGLWVLTAGTVPQNSAELLSSPQFKHLLSVVTQHFDWVVIDTPPVMAVADAALVAHTAAAVLFVVGSERTSLPSALNALERLEAANARYVGAVLNRVNLKRDAFFYSDYYRREYREYYHDIAAKT